MKTVCIREAAGRRREVPVIPVFYGCNDAFAQHLCVSLHSLLATTRHQVHIHVLDGGISPLKKQKIVELVSRHDHGAISFLEVDAALFRGLPVSSHFSIASWYRCVIHQVRPDLDKAVYLDCDVVVRVCIRELYDTDISDSYAAVVEDPWIIMDRRKALLGMAECSRYFNAGVMLMNLRRIRHDRVLEGMTEVVSRYGEFLQFPDQDLLNILFRGAVTFVDPSWNVIDVVYRDKGVWVQHRAYTREHFVQCCTNPRIVHFTGRSTLWLEGCGEHLHKFWLEYYRYLKGTGFSRALASHPVVLLFKRYVTRERFQSVRRWLIQIHLTSRVQIIRLFGVYLLNRRRSA